MAEPVSTLSCIDAHSELTAKLNQLEAALLMTIGGGLDVFSTMSPGSQEDYLKLCTDLVQRCVELAAMTSPGS